MPTIKCPACGKQTYKLEQFRDREYLHLHWKCTDYACGVLCLIGFDTISVELVEKPPEIRGKFIGRS